MEENRFFCPDWVRDNWADVLQPALFQHVKLTAIAVGVGFLIAFVAALVAHRYRLVEGPFAAFSALVYTIPSVALFQLLVPVTGLTVTTVEVALVGYTLLILFRNVLEGLRSAPPEVLEAARGMGYTRRQTLWRVELPLALPAIVAGLRVATVSTIAIATIAAFVIPEGLGRPIFIAPARLLQDGDRRRRRARDPARARGRRAPRAHAAGADALGAGAEDGVIAAFGTFGDALSFIVERRELLLEKTWEHLLLSGAAMAVAVVLAVPLGVWLGHLHRGSFIAINAANVGRALPSLAVIAIGLSVFGFGFTNVLVALVILAVPPILTNAYVAVDEVEPEAVEAARGMGMTGWQTLRRVELPLALPLLFAGIRTAAVFVVASATIAAIAGGGGLGEILFNQASYRTEGLVGAAIVVSLLAFAADFALGLLQRVLTPRGLRTRVPAFEPDVVVTRTGR